MKIFFQSMIAFLACSILYTNIGYAGGFNEEFLKKPKFITSNKLYLKVGIINTNYKKFKETGQYDNTSPKADKTLNIGGGYRCTNLISIDINLQHIKTKYKNIDASDEIIESTQKIKTTTFFINGYYYYNFNYLITPYFTAGIGIGKNNTGTFRQTITILDLDLTRTFLGKTTTHFIWNIGAGIKYHLNKNFSLAMEYRYVDMGKIKIEEGILYDGATQLLRGNQIIGSLIYNF